jgi:hypothetical protein
MEQMSEDARAMIRAAEEVHAERHGTETFLPGTYISFPEAAKRSGIRSDRQDYYDAIDELEYEGAIEWDPSARYARGTSTTLSPSAAWMGCWVRLRRTFQAVPNKVRTQRK